MPIASPPDLLLGAAFQGVDPQRIVARWCGVALALFAPVALLPGIILPNPVPLALVLAAAVAVLAAGLPAARFRFDLATPISIAFAATGVLYVGLSLMDMLPAGARRPMRPEFVLRHSYYVLLWLPLIAGATALSRQLFPDLRIWAERLGIPVLAFLAVGDLVTAYLWGVPERMIWEGYVPFFDPPLMNFLYAASFFLYVATARRIVLPLAIVSAHAIVSGATDHGTIYNTMTGNFVLACMFAFALIFRRSPAWALFAVMGLGILLMGGLLIGMVAPDAIGFDINTQWRFYVWRENLFAALQSGLIGVGFGTPYYQLSLGNIYDAYRLTQYAEFAQYALGSPIDLLYIRGQHSSLVNAFYRMGLLGGGFFLAFNLAVIAVVVRGLRRTAPDLRPLVAATGAIFIVEACQVLLHVGVESPRYLAAYALTVGLARAVSHFAARGDG